MNLLPFNPDVTETFRQANEYAFLQICRALSLPPYYFLPIKWPRRKFDPPYLRAARKSIRSQRRLP